MRECHLRLGALLKRSCLAESLSRKMGVGFGLVLKATMGTVMLSGAGNF
jgi:hypothetical protein